MPTFRRVPEAKFERYHRMLDYAFDAESGPQEYEDGVPSRPGERWGLFEDDRLLTTCMLYDFEVRWRGAWATLGGLAGVASPPEHRRKGYVREMVREALAEYRDRGIPWVALWPFDYEFYRRLGWATANKFTTYEFAPEALDAAAAEPYGEFEPIDADDWEELQPVAVEHGSGTTLSMRRSETWWRERIFDHWGEQPYVYGWRDEAGDLRGYVVYGIERDDSERKLEVYDFSYVDHAAYRQLLRFLYTHESQITKVTLKQAIDTSLLDMVEDPRAVECTISTGPMIRLGDVRVALSKVPYPDGVDEEVVVHVDDPLADWNDERLSLSVADGQADCTGTVTPPDVMVDVNTLSQVIVGYYDVEEARQLGELHCDEETARRLGKLFPPQQVCLREFF